MNENTGRARKLRQRVAELADVRLCCPEGAPMSVQKIGVVGAGTMGNGIAHVFARSGYEVVLCDVEQSILDRALATISANLDREVVKNKITADQKTSALGRMKTSLNRGQLGGCDFVVEAASEKFAIKAEL